MATFEIASVPSQPLTICSLTSCLTNSTLNTQTSSPQVNHVLGKHQARVLLSLKLISDVYPSSHPGFEPGLFRMGAWVTSTLPSPSGPIRITGSNLSRFRPQCESTKPDDFEGRRDYCPLASIECLPPSQVFFEGLGYCPIWPVSRLFFMYVLQLLASGNVIFVWLGRCTRWRTELSSAACNSQSGWFIWIGSKKYIYNWFM